MLHLATLAVSLAAPYVVTMVGYVRRELTCMHVCFFCLGFPETQHTGELPRFCLKQNSRSNTTVDEEECDTPAVAPCTKLGVRMPCLDLAQDQTPCDQSTFVSNVVE